MFQGHVPLFLDDALGFFDTCIINLTLFGSCYYTNYVAIKLQRKLHMFRTSFFLLTLPAHVEN